MPRVNQLSSGDAKARGRGRVQEPKGSRHVLTPGPGHLLPPAVAPRTLTPAIHRLGL